MSKTSKSQWNFGELFPTEETRRVLSVGELTTQIKRLLEKQVGSVWVGGEITNLRAQSSGHIYFTLKDASAQLSCVLFRNEAVAHRDLLKDGQKVLLQGDITVYEARGQYQLLVHAVELQGVGALQLKFEQLKQKLATEGLFAQERKRPLPKFPQRIGIVTSPTGAAIRDVLHVIQRRNPALEIILAPCRVQGDGAAGEIAEAIRLLNEFHVGVQASACLDGEAGGNKLKLELQQQRLDLILVTRGGGSLEDLWAFNEEAVARAIFESTIPIVSAVGHEIDFTISDFVADVRAATPSAAAEIITEGMFASREFVAGASAVLRQRVRQQLDRHTEGLDDTLHRLQRAHPRRQIAEWMQRVDELHANAIRTARQAVNERKVAHRNAAMRLLRASPRQFLKLRRETLATTTRRLQEHARVNLREQRNELRTLESRLRLLGPEQVLGRGYSITLDDETGKVLRDAKQIKPGQRLRTKLKSGEVRSRVDGK
ncbi:MAG: exodeoxyribonuclease VII large subunit [Verrucomicrobia bacterium]|nr:exodeoxyribonuclease VII large subunit [Verrucomicrobiota bacterium]